MTKAVFHIQGMHCTSCAMNIDFDLEDLEGIVSAKTNYAKAITEVEFDDKIVTLEKVREQIHKTGYEVI